MLRQVLAECAGKRVKMFLASQPWRVSDQGESCCVRFECKKSIDEF